MIKGEQAGDFATRLKLDYEESEMAKATVWSHFEYKIISSLDTSGTDNRDLKTKLIEECGKNPDPDEEGLESFLKVIRDHEAMVKAREFKEMSGAYVTSVRPDGEPIVAQNPHRVCGKVHGRGECKFQCPECKKPHRKEDCYELHPEKRPKSWITPPKKKGKGRGSDRERSRGNDRERSRSKSVEKREKPKDRRAQSPYPPRARADRITNSDRFTDRDSAEESEKEKEDERELERALEKAEKLKEKIEKRKGSGNARRVRTELFEANKRESEFRDLERDWSRESSRDPRGRESRDWTRYCRRVTKSSDSPPTGEPSCILSGGGGP